MLVIGMVVAGVGAGDLGGADLGGADLGVGAPLADPLSRMPFIPLSKCPGRKQPSSNWPASNGTSGVTMTFELGAIRTASPVCPYCARRSTQASPLRASRPHTLAVNRVSAGHELVLERPEVLEQEGNRLSRVEIHQRRREEEVAHVTANAAVRSCRAARRCRGGARSEEVRRGCQDHLRAHVLIHPQLAKPSGGMLVPLDVVRGGSRTRLARRLHETIRSPSDPRYPLCDSMISPSCHSGSAASNARIFLKRSSCLGSCAFAT